MSEPSQAGVWGEKCDQALREIERQEARLDQLHARYAEDLAAWRAARPGREDIDAQIRLVSELKSALIASVQIAIHAQARAADYPTRPPAASEAGRDIQGEPKGAT